MLNFFFHCRIIQRRYDAQHSCDDDDNDDGGVVAILANDNTLRKEWGHARKKNSRPKSSYLAHIITWHWKFARSFYTITNLARFSHSKCGLHTLYLRFAPMSFGSSQIVRYFYFYALSQLWTMAWPFLWNESNGRLGNCCSTSTNPSHWLLTR